MFHCFFCAMSARMHIQKDMYSTKNNLSTASTIIIVSLTLTHCHTFSHTQSHNYWNIFGIFCNVKYILQTAKPTKINVHVLASRACGYYTYFYMLQQWPNVNKVTLLGPPSMWVDTFSSLKGLRGSWTQVRVVLKWGYTIDYQKRREKKNRCYFVRFLVLLCFMTLSYNQIIYLDYVILCKKKNQFMYFSIKGSHKSEDKLTQAR